MSLDSMRIARIVAINLLVVLGFLSIVNLICYLSLNDFGKQTDDRARLPNYSDNEYAAKIFDDFHEGIVSYRSYIGWSREEFSGETTTINAAGDRIHGQIVDPSKPTVRFFGGSTMWGTGADDRNTIPALFDQVTGDRFNVFNYGEKGFNSRAEVARLVNIANQNRPLDWVIFYDGVNDVAKQCRRKVDINSHEREKQINEALRSMSVGGMLSGLFADLFYRYTIKQIKEMKAGDVVKADRFRCHLDESYADLVAETMINNWKIARDIVKGRGGRFIAILQPVAYLSTTRKNAIDLRQDLAPQYQAVYPKVKEKIRGIDWIFDFGEVFDIDDYIYIDFCHVDNKGNRIIAERVSELIDL